ncbi:hypothetical protein GQF01_23435 [Paenibacillus sp. 5J-6]|uniref:Uncharacterized protein n=1 Tax=Paenibacillus silvestris TaxID=2606219 RepID=A0A6L8V653_9BACL|nr:hypothetical protein [Paenibacillus silvestris]MZQ85072.1 hypothetical protein [Paenibacillus silvestris]
MKIIAGVIGVAYSNQSTPLPGYQGSIKVWHSVEELPIKKDRKTKRNPLSSTVYPASLPIGSLNAAAPAERSWHTIVSIINPN